MHPEDGERIAADVETVEANLLLPLVPREALLQRPAECAVTHRALAADLFPDRVRPSRHSTLVAGDVSGNGDEAIRFTDGQRLKEQRMHEREDRGRCANT